MTSPGPRRHDSKHTERCCVLADSIKLPGSLVFKPDFKSITAARCGVPERRQLPEPRVIINSVRLRVKWFSCRENKAHQSLDRSSDCIVPLTGTQLSAGCYP